MIEELPTHYVRSTRTRENILAFQGQVPRRGETIWTGNEQDLDVLQYRVIEVEWQISPESGQVYARVYVEPLARR
jgi:hypothetical protein